MNDNNVFQSSALSSFLTNNLQRLGYEQPTPVQQVAIPLLLEGHDVLAQAQTGTGKTAAFALPVLNKIDLNVNKPQAIVIAPTRELAIQVAEAFHNYAKGAKGFHVLPIYGGQDYPTQIKGLKRGAQVIVGTTGRIMDHIRRKTLATDSLSIVVLDEADEMLNMGFAEDIEWILEQISQPHQTALFSATMPPRIKKIADKFLNQPKFVEIKPTKQSVANITQQCIKVYGNQKMEALTRYLEFEHCDATIIFVRTKTASQEVADKLQARGYTVAALNGDMKQSLRERVIQQIKQNTIDIIVATDVAARGIDVSRITHVINYDIPTDPESYTHRIGRTGRAGRTGKSLILVTPKEGRLLKDIERCYDAPIEQIEAPTIEQLTEKRNSGLFEMVDNIISKSKRVKDFIPMINGLTENGHSAIDIAAAFAYLYHQETMADFEQLETVSYKSMSEKKKPARKVNKSRASHSQKGFESRQRQNRTKRRPNK